VNRRSFLKLGAVAPALALVARRDPKPEEAPHLLTKEMQLEVSIADRPGWTKVDGGYQFGDRRVLGTLGRDGMRDGWAAECAEYSGPLGLRHITCMGEGVEGLERCLNHIDGKSSVWESSGVVGWADTGVLVS
jgi:hypothetical protein